MKLFKHLFSGWFMGVLLITFAAVIGKATFIENDHGAKAANLLIYGTWWFELILLLMVVNFSGMIFTKKLYLKSKWNVLIIHLALVIIIIGAGVTRYFGVEGQMRIREGQTSNFFMSNDNFVQVTFKNGEKEFNYADKFVLSAGIEGDLYNKSYDVNDETINIRVTDYYPSSELIITPSDEGDSYLSMVVGGPSGRQEFYLKEGDVKMLPGIGLSYGDTTQKELITIVRREDGLFIKLPEAMSATSNSGDSVVLEVNGYNPVEPMSVQTFGGISFVIKSVIPNAKLDYKRSDKEGGKPIIKVKVNDEELIVADSKEQILNVNNTEVSLKVGSIAMELPFALKLNKFNLERYPGSMSPSSFASEVTLIDEVNKVEMPYKIYMNHILNYGGYRFFQSSYDNDERGTILSVNHDYWGTFITYFGYFLLFASLIALFFTANTRFRRISYQLKDVHEQRKKLSVSAVFILAMLGATSSFAQTGVVDSDHATKFGQLFIQNKEGRIEPVNTMATKILVKISKKSSYKDLTADQVFLGIITNQTFWQKEPIIKIGNSDVQKLIGVSDDYAAFENFIDAEGKYKLLPEVEKANIKKPSERSTYDKDIINIDERLNVFYMALNSSVLKIFPIENDPNNRWAIPQEHHQIKGHGNKNAELFDDYILSLKDAMATSDYKKADQNIEAIAAFQKSISSDILPSETHAKLEIFYNKANIFKTLFPFYLMIGIILVCVFFLETFKPQFEMKWLKNILLVILLIGFALQTVGLGIRWYISGHAPWSNGYESMIYISWATLLAGFIFMRKSYITLGVTASLAGITLLTAHMSWLNPELTNLVPVLKSYWLTIHVATITASYGFLGLGCMVAFLNLVSMIFRTEKNYDRISLILRELTLIVEMALSVGLILLIIGNFLGGIWANESWGRYWGWDPKETWTLVTIILYSFTLHLTLIPSIRTSFSFNFFSVISFGAVLMTYFGVNYYLSGLHSYASGDSVPVPSFVYYSLGIFFMVSILAAYNEFRLEKSDEEDV